LHFDRLLEFIQQRGHLRETAFQRLTWFCSVFVCGPPANGLLRTLTALSGH
jgi:hypothetical protein